MKRKLNEEQIPTPVKPVPPHHASLSFASFGLDSRLLQAITQENFSAPTPVQAKAIPHVLDGKDIFARARTGSGKTAAYLLPILEAILRRKNDTRSAKDTVALILVPTRELAQQVTKVIATFTSFCTKDIRAVNLTQKVPDAVQRSLLADSPEIIVSTPARVAVNLNSSALTFANLAYLVIDEADLVLSYGYEEDLQTIQKALPKGVQTILTSATLTAEVETLRGLFCQDPVLLELEEVSDDKNGLTQYVVQCGEDEKFLLAYVIFKLKLVKGKCIIFVGNTDRCYRLKLYFEQFGIRSCVLNSELPVNSRIHVVEEFNKNVYDIIIAADDHEVLGERASKRISKSRKNKDTMPERDEAAESANALQNGTPLEQDGDTDAPPSKAKAKAPKRSKKANEYGVSRGIDFQNVTCVLNFDLPTSSTSYTHRVGRTARANQPGIALSFVVPASTFGKHKPTSFPPCAQDEEVLLAITTQQQNHGQELKPYHFDMKQVEGFKYRMNDALRAVTSTAVREARTREIRQELLKSDKLKRHFEENPEDLRQLRHDGEVGKVRVQGHLKHVPSYLMPSNGAQGIVKEDVGFVGLRKETDNRIRRKRLEKARRGKAGKGPVKRADPLKTFNAKGKGK